MVSLISNNLDKVLQGVGVGGKSVFHRKADFLTFPRFMRRLLRLKGWRSIKTSYLEESRNIWDSTGVTCTLYSLIVCSNSIPRARVGLDGLPYLNIA